MNDAITAIEAGDLRTAADISLKYYDRAYLKSMSALPRETTVNLSSEGLEDAVVVEELIKAATIAIGNAEITSPQ